jgi:hypothetical protein
MFGLKYWSFGWVSDLGYIRSWCLHKLDIQHTSAYKIRTEGTGAYLSMLDI